MKNKFSLFVVVIFLSFCFVIFYKGLNTPNNYTPKINERKNIPTFKTAKAALASLAALYPRANGRTTDSRSTEPTI